MTATCHPDRPHRALDLCGPCYFRAYRAARKALGRPMRSMMSKAQRAAL